VGGRQKAKVLSLSESFSEEFSKRAPTTRVWDHRAVPDGSTLSRESDSNIL
jgi:hypothetical protein